ncbi:hypothetical protein ABPG75_005156 [Micractinium tetrahymenae]
MAAHDAVTLVTNLPAGTAESVLAWLTSRGRDLPVHIPLATIKFARECFTLIDVDGSGTLEPEELQAVFRALGKPASLRQVTRLVESVAGSGARSLKFSDFAQMMHGAMSSKRREELEMHSLMQQEVNLGGGWASTQAGFGRGGAGSRPGTAAAAAAAGKSAEAEPELSWGDFHLLAKAFRRRKVVDGIIEDSAGWRQKVLALAERRAQTARTAAVSAASVWRHRALRLQQQQQQDAHAAEGGAAAAEARIRAPCSAAPATAGEGDMLAGAISAGPTPRGDCGPDIVIDEKQQKEEEQGKKEGQVGSAPAGASGEPSPAQAAAASLPQQRQLSPIVQQLLSRLRANAVEAGQALPGEVDNSASDPVPAVAATGTAGSAAVRAAAGKRSPTACQSRPASRVAWQLPTHDPAPAGNRVARQLPTHDPAPAGNRVARQLPTHDPAPAGNHVARQLPTHDPAPAGNRVARQHPPATPGLAALSAGPPGCAADMAAAGRETEGIQEAREDDNCSLLSSSPAPGESPAGGSIVGDASGFDWRRSAARMRLAAAANRQAIVPDTAPAAAASIGTGGAAPLVARPGTTLGAGSRLLVATASSRARTAPCTSTHKIEHCAAKGGPGGSRAHSRAGEQEPGRQAAAAQRAHLAAVALIRGRGSRQH